MHDSRSNVKTHRQPMGAGGVKLRRHDDEDAERRLEAVPSADYGSKVDGGEILNFLGRCAAYDEL